MTRRAVAFGNTCQFYRRNAKCATIRWHSVFKAIYRSKADALKAKEIYEATGKLLLPSEIRKLARA